MLKTSRSSLGVNAAYKGAMVSQLSKTRLDQGIGDDCTTIIKHLLRLRHTDVSCQYLAFAWWGKAHNH